MKETRVMMNMPITVEITDTSATTTAMEKIFSYFEYVENNFSVFKNDSEISRLNRGELLPADYSQEMKEVLEKSDATKQSTNGYFDIWIAGRLNPSGLVKGWAIHNAAKLLLADGFRNFYVDAGGDLEAHGHNANGAPWTIGIRNPFNLNENVKIIYLPESGLGVATSGTYIRGQHIINPHDNSTPLTDIVSLTIIGPNIYEADRFATAAFAMGRSGINFIEGLNGFEGYSIDQAGRATMTSGFEQYTIKPAVATSKI